MSGCGHPANAISTHSLPGLGPDGSRVLEQDDVPPPPGDDYLSLQDLVARRLQQRIQFEHVTEEEGLASEPVFAITQDRFGFLWIANDKGLFRYDGLNFVAYSHDPTDPHSLSHNHVLDILEDHLGILWIATDGGGLDRFDRDTQEFVHYTADPNTLDSLSHDKVSVLYEDLYGVLWVGTLGGGLNQYDRKADSFVQYRHDPHDPYSLAHDTVHAICEDRAGLLWIGTDQGLSRFDRRTHQFIHYQHDSGNPGSLIHDSIASILEDRWGYLWIGTNGGGLDRLDRRTERFIHYRHDAGNSNSLGNDLVSVLLEDSSGTLWVGTQGGGLHQYDRENDRFIRHQYVPGDPYSLNNNHVNALFEDREGTLWVGTTRNLDKFARQRAKFDQFLAYEHVQVVLEGRDSSVWVGTLDKLVHLTETLTEIARYAHDPEDPDSLSDGWVQALYQDREGILWIGLMGGGLDRFDPASGRFVHHRHEPTDPNSLSSDIVNLIYEDQAGVLWVGTDSGLNQYDRDQGVFRVVPTEPDVLGAPSLENVGPILEDRTGALWVGVWGDGLRRLEPGTDQFVAFRHEPSNPQSLKTNFVTWLFQDSSGRMWVGTDSGLHQWLPAENTFFLYGSESGLPSDTVDVIVEDQDGKLWLAVGAGLFKFDPDAGTSTHYDGDDGLRAGGYSSGIARRGNGRVLFGGVDGIDVFLPQQVWPNPYVPPVVLLAVRQDGKEIEGQRAWESVDSLSFSWPNSDFEFEFAALSYTQPDKNLHAYKLEGYDNDWHMIGTQRVGEYRNLPGGTYTLRLKGSNDDGIWNDTGLSIRIAVAPPIWETWWFLGSAVLVLAGVAFAGYRLRVRSVETRSQHLSDLVTERTAELSRINERLSREILERQKAEDALARRAADAAVIEERSRLARELHDAVTQTLFSASLIAEALPSVWEADREEGLQLLKDLRQLSRGALAEMRTLLLELRPTALMESSFRDLLRQLGEAIAGRIGVPVQVTVEGTCDFPADVHVALYRIAQEALNNVVKHAEATQVRVFLTCTPDPVDVDTTRHQEVELVVEDNGRGFDPERISSDHLGLNIIRERARDIGAHFEIKSEPGWGTRIRILWKE